MQSWWPSGQRRRRGWSRAGTPAGGRGRARRRRGPAHRAGGAEERPAPAPPARRRGGPARSRRRPAGCSSRQRRRQDVHGERGEIGLQRRAQGGPEGAGRGRVAAARPPAPGRGRRSWSASASAANRSGAQRLVAQRARRDPDQRAPGAGASSPRARALAGSGTGSRSGPARFDAEGPQRLGVELGGVGPGQRPVVPEHRAQAPARGCAGGSRSARRRHQGQVAALHLLLQVDGEIEAAAQPARQRDRGVLALLAQPVDLGEPGSPARAAAPPPAT